MIKREEQDKLILEQLKRINEEEGYLNAELIKEKSNIPRTELVDFLHRNQGLQNVCKKHNFTYKFCRHISFEDIEKDILRVYAEQGKIDTKMYVKYGKYSMTTVGRVAKGLNVILEKNNIPLNMSRMATPEQVGKDIVNICAKYNSVSTNIYRKYGTYSESVVARCFGTWENALKTLNIPYYNCNIGKDEMLRQLKEIYYKYGALNSTIIYNLCTFSYQAVRFYFPNVEELRIALGVPNKNFFDKRITSYNEYLINAILKTKYNDVHHQYTWKWLINDRTGKHLWVDFYLPEINLAIEYDGGQHHYHVKYQTKPSNALDKVQYRDKLKTKLLEEHNIPLLRIPHTVKINEDYLFSLINHYTSK